MIRDFIIALVAAFLVDQVTGISRRVAILLVRWAADHMYVDDPELAAERKEEWEALVRESINNGIVALFFALGLACAGLYCITIPRVPAALRAIWRKVCRSFDLEWISALFAMAAGLELGPSLNSLKDAGILMGISLCLLSLQWAFERVKSAVDRQRLSGAHVPPDC